MLNFMCDMCAECCRHIDGIEELSQFDNGEGVCVYLLDNKCSIYEHRPDVCNIQKMYNIKYKDIFSETEYLKLNYQGCDRLKKIKKTAAPV